MTNELTAKVSLRLERLLLGVLNGSPTGVTKGLSCVLCWVKFSSICINDGPNVSSSCVEKDNVHTINKFYIRLKNLLESFWKECNTKTDSNGRNVITIFFQKLVTYWILIVRRAWRKANNQEPRKKLLMILTLRSFVDASLMAVRLPLPGVFTFVSDKLSRLLNGLIICVMDDMARFSLRGVLLNENARLTLFPNLHVKMRIVITGVHQRFC